MAAFKKLEMFDGFGDVERFIDRFDFAVNVDELPAAKEASYLAMHLSGAAFDVWKNMGESDKKDSSEIKKVLRNTYGVRRSAAWRAMTAYRVSAGQQLDSACEDLHKWAKIVIAGKDPASALAAVAFVEALPTHIAQKVRVLCGQSATKEEVVAAAKEVWDDGMCEVTALASRSAQRSARPRVESHELTSSNRWHRSFETPGEETRRCYGCGTIGHLRKSCTAECTHCGEKRHTRRYCQKTGNESGEL